MLSIECCKDIAKITCRNYSINLVSGFNLTICKKSCISIYIINNLWYKTSDIDWVSWWELKSCLCHLFFKLFVSENLLYTSLCIIKGSFDSDYICIITLLCNHLFFLNRADTILRIKYNNTCSLNIGKSCKCSFSCIAWCSCKNNYLIMYVILLSWSYKQMWKYWKCHILECNSCTMEKFQIISTISFDKRCDYICIKLFIICLVDTSL